jgi:anaphase-promoting complex subunit 1
MGRSCTLDHNIIIFNFVTGLRYAGTGNADAQELLYSYSIYFLNEVMYCLRVISCHSWAYFLRFHDKVFACAFQIKPVASSNWGRHPKGLSKYVERATLETCLSVVVLSLSLVRELPLY